MNNNNFDKYAGMYDTWFMNNRNVLYSELKLVAHFLKESTGSLLSVGCGSGLFEYLLDKEYGIRILEGIEPSKDMAEIARKRGMNVTVGTAEEADFGHKRFDTILFNGTPSYITDLQKAFLKAYAALKPNGRIVAIDVPKESSYALLYNLAKAVETWDHPLLKEVHPHDPYPIELVKLATWRTTAEKVDMLTKAGFSDIQFAQTLTKHPIYSNNAIEEPIEGFDCGDYVAICATKK